MHQVQIFGKFINSGKAPWFKSKDMDAGLEVQGQWLSEEIKTTDIH
jgi:hypothetical protein